MTAALYQGQCVGTGPIKSVLKYAVIGQNPTAKYYLAVGISAVFSTLECTDSTNGLLATRRVL